MQAMITQTLWPDRRSSCRWRPALRATVWCRSRRTRPEAATTTGRRAHRPGPRPRRISHSRRCGTPRAPRRDRRGSPGPIRPGRRPVGGPGPPGRIDDYHRQQVE